MKINETYTEASDSSASEDCCKTSPLLYSGFFGVTLTHSVIERLAFSAECCFLNGRPFFFGVLTVTDPLESEDDFRVSSFFGKNVKLPRFSSPSMSPASHIDSSLILNSSFEISSSSSRNAMYNLSVVAFFNFLSDFCT